jgi:hypothetical protein
MESLVIVCLYHLASGTSMDLPQMDEREYFISLCNAFTMAFGCCLSEPITKWDTLKKKFKIRGHKLSIKGNFNKIKEALERFKQKVETEMTDIFGSAEMALLHELEETLKRLNKDIAETYIHTHCYDACPNIVSYFNALVEIYKFTNKSECLDRDQDFERKIYSLHATLTCVHKYTYIRFKYYNYIMKHCMTVGTAAYPQMSEVVVRDNDEYRIINHQQHALLTDAGLFKQCMAP